MTDRNLGVALASPLLLALLCGCLASEDSVTIPVPRLGDRYVYSTGDGGSLVAEVKEVALRPDAFGKPFESLIVAWTYSTPAPQATSFGFEESISLADRRIVQQVATCGSPQGETLEGPWYCNGTRLEVNFGAGGLPGGFGSSPFWGRTIAPGNAAVPIDSLADPRTRLDLTGKATSFEGRTCVAFEGTVPPQEMPRVLPWTGAGSAMTLCEGLALPVKFSPLFRGPVPFTGDGLGEHVLQEYRPGTGTAGLGDQPVARRQETGLQRLDSPHYAAGNDAGLFFDPSEAHAEARNLSEEYRSLSDAGASVISFLYLTTEWTDIADAYRQDRGKAILWLVAADGEGMTITVEKSVQRVAIDLPPRYAALDDAPVSFASAPNINPEQAPLQNALDRFYGFRGHGEDVEPAIIGFSQHGLIQPSWSNHAKVEMRTSGYDLFVESEDPEAEASGLISFYHPYYFVVDGATGGLLWIHALPSELANLDAAFGGNQSESAA
jgi:hypothetical protein